MAGPLLPAVGTGVINCYKPFSAEVEGSLFGHREIADTMHYLAIPWFPMTSFTRPLDGYFTFWCKVDDTAPSVCSHGRATMAV